jgi:catechol 2,3-dioxygenase-like lactoylglutathione lyase family enzyme
MNKTDFKVEQIDHVHVYVSDQCEAAKWYESVLGLEIIKEYEDWAADGGPLTISSDGGGTSLALFKRVPLNNSEIDRSKTVAFRVGGEGFITFLKSLPNNQVKDQSGKIITGSDIVDHDRSFSIYFCDPYGNPYELTTYDYKYVQDHIGNQ